jgi:DNA helicase-4
VVIILDAKERSYPLIHPNWVFARILGESVEAIVDESRRLFYVSLTRAREEVFIITEGGRESPFLVDISSHPAVSLINWSKYPTLVTQHEWVTVKVSGEYKMMLPLIDCLKADSFRYRDLSKHGGYRSWDRSYRVRELTDSFLVDTSWMTTAREQKLSGVVVRFYDGVERCFMACTISAGDLLNEAQPGSRLFDLNEMKSALVPPEPVDVLAPEE